MNQQPYTVHPLVARYLHDLDVLLQGIEPVERAEVVEGVREHIETSLSHTDRSDSDVRAALDEVGPATAVAEEAWTGRTSPVPSQRTPATSRAWLPNTVAFFEAATLLMVMVAVGGSAAVSSSSATVTTEDGQTTTEVTQSSFDGSIGGAVTALFAAIPFWLVILVLVGVSALWTARQKTVLMVLPARGGDRLRGAADAGLRADRDQRGVRRSVDRACSDGRRWRVPGVGARPRRRAAQQGPGQQCPAPTSRRFAETLPGPRSLDTPLLGPG